MQIVGVELSGNDEDVEAVLVGVVENLLGCECVGSGSGFGVRDMTFMVPEDCLPDFLGALEGVAGLFGVEYGCGALEASFSFGR